MCLFSARLFAQNIPLCGPSTALSITGGAACPWAWPGGGVRAGLRVPWFPVAWGAVSLVRGGCVALGRGWVALNCCQ